MTDSVVPARRDRWEVRLAVLATIVALVPFAIAALQVIGHRMTPVGDSAIIDLRTRDVFTSATPLLGVYSRFGWNHPGPVMYWLLAPFTLVAGAAWGMYLGAIAIQTAGVAWSARVAWRRGGALLTLGVLVLQGLTYVALRSGYPWLRPWNPTMALPFLVVFALLAWSVVLGELRSLPYAVGVGSFLVLTHVGYLPLVAAGGGWIVVAVVRHRAARATRAFRHALIASGAVLVVLWLPAVVEQVLHGRAGNIVEIVRSATGARLPHGNQGSLSRAGWHRGLGLLAAEFHWVPPWLGGSELPARAGLAGPAPIAWIVVPVAAIGVGALAAWRARDRAAGTAMALAATFAVAGAAALIQFRGDFTPYAFYWRIPLALLVLGAALGAVLRWWGLRGHRWRPIAVALVLGAVLVASTVTSIRTVSRNDRDGELVTDLAATLSDQLRPRVPLRGHVRLRQAGDGSVYTGVMVGLLDELDRDGLHVDVSRHYAEEYLDGGHVWSDRKVSEQWVVAEGATIGHLLAQPGTRVLAASSPLSPVRERRLRALQEAVRTRLATAGRADLSVWLGLPGIAQYASVVGPAGAADVQELARLDAEVLRSGRLRYAVIGFRRGVPSGLLAW